MESAQVNLDSFGVSEKEILASSPVLSRLCSSVGFENKSQIANLVLLVFAPFLIFSVATIMENRFFLGSVTSWNESVGDVIVGMSFLGDTMVWPYFILVPVALLVLKESVGRTSKFFTEVQAVIDPRFLSERREEYEELLSHAKKGLAALGSWKWLKMVAIFVAIGFCLWNAITCTFVDIFYPYKTEVVFIQNSPGPISLPTAIPIPKWDTNVAEAPVSWLLTRVWVFFGYGLVPIMLFKIVNLMGVLYAFCSRLSKKRNFLQIKPLSPDRAGGLSSLSEAALSFMYFFIPIFLMASSSFFKESAPASAHNYVLVILFVPLLVASFIFPLSAVHGAMKSAKERSLTTISREFIKQNDRLFVVIKKGAEAKDELEHLDRTLDVLKKTYEQVEKLPVWPMEISSLMRFFGALLVPIILFFLDRIFS